MKTLMILEGGSYRGIYTSGVLDVFMERGLYPDCVLGISAGALNGLGYVAKQPGRCRDIVLNYGTDKRYVGSRALRKEHNLVGFDFILRDLQKIMPFDEETLRSPERKFYAVVTNCRTGKAEYIDRDDCEDFMTAVAASCSMPYLCRKVPMGQDKYLDGGISEQLGMGFVQQHPEYDRIVVILTRRLSYRKSPVSKMMSRLAVRLYGDDPMLLDDVLRVDEIYAAQREMLAELVRQGRAMVVEPEFELNIGHLERDIDNLKLGYETGQRDAERYFDRVKRFMTGE